MIAITTTAQDHPTQKQSCLPWKGLHHSFLQGERTENLLCAKQYSGHQKYSNEQTKVLDSEKLILQTENYNSIF